MYDNNNNNSRQYYYTYVNDIETSEIQSSSSQDYLFIYSLLHHCLLTSLIGQDIEP